MCLLCRLWLRETVKACVRYWSFQQLLDFILFKSILDNAKCFVNRRCIALNIRLLMRIRGVERTCCQKTSLKHDLRKQRAHCQTVRIVESEMREWWNAGNRQR